MAVAFNALIVALFALCQPAVQARAIQQPRGLFSSGAEYQGDRKINIVTGTVVITPSLPENIVTVQQTINVVNPTVVATHVAYVDNNNNLVATALFRSDNRLSFSNSPPSPDSDSSQPQVPVNSAQPSVISVDHASPSVVVVVESQQSNQVSPSPSVVVDTTVVEPGSSLAADSVAIETVVDTVSAIGSSLDGYASSFPESSYMDFTREQNGHTASPVIVSSYASTAPAVTVVQTKTVQATENSDMGKLLSSPYDGQTTDQNPHTQLAVVQPDNVSPDVSVQRHVPSSQDTTTTLTLTSTIVVTADPSPKFSSPSSTTLQQVQVQAPLSTASSSTSSSSITSVAQVPSQPPVAAQSTVVTLGVSGGVVLTTVPMTTLSTKLFIPSQAASSLSVAANLQRRSVLHVPENVKFSQNLDHLIAQQDFGDISEYGHSN